MARSAGTRSRIEPDQGVVRRLSGIVLCLPGVVEQEAWTGVRWRVRTRTVAHVMVAQPGWESAYRDVTGDPEPRTILTFHSSGDELMALAHAGLPFYQPPWSPSVIGLVIGDGTDWQEVAELVTESYRCCAPQKLVRLLDT